MLEQLDLLRMDHDSQMSLLALNNCHSMDRREEERVLFFWKGSGIRDMGAIDAISDVDVHA